MKTKLNARLKKSDNLKQPCQVMPKNHWYILNFQLKKSNCYLLSTTTKNNKNKKTFKTHTFLFFSTTKNVSTNFRTFICFLFGKNKRTFLSLISFLLKFRVCSRLFCFVWQTSSSTWERKFELRWGNNRNKPKRSFEAGKQLKRTKKVI
jgi:hypothetical protein